MNADNVHGDFPEFCYKVFNRKKYAEDFIDRGTFHLNCRYYCGILGASRRDPTDGSGRTKELGVVTSIGISPNREEKPICRQEMGYQEHQCGYTNAIFLFCTSLPKVNLQHLRDNFGEYIVKIKDPRKLADDISGYFVSKGQNVLIKGCSVVYNKGQEQERELEVNERLDLSYKQKEFEKYHHDCEFRIVAIGGLCNAECEFLDGRFEWVESECRFIVVNLGKPLSYTHLCES